MEDPKLEPGHEIVFTISDYYDGPIKGIANYQGKPHFYECIFDESAGYFSESFLLTPLNSETFLLAMEDWEIWRRWEVAFHSGKANLNTHPALPPDANRHAELKRVLEKSLVSDPLKAITRIGQFRGLGESNLRPGVLRPLQVKWSNPTLLPDNYEMHPDLSDNH